jgi:hypothetical protein
MTHVYNVLILVLIASFLIVILVLPIEFIRGVEETVLVLELDLIIIQILYGALIV